jgi:hypothetical protein
MLLNITRTRRGLVFSIVNTLRDLVERNGSAGFLSVTDGKISWFSHRYPYPVVPSLFERGYPPTCNENAVLKALRKRAVL